MIGHTSSLPDFFNASLIPTTFPLICVRTYRFESVVLQWYIFFKLVTPFETNFTLFNNIQTNEMALGVNLRRDDVVISVMSDKGLSNGTALFSHSSVATNQPTIMLVSSDVIRQN